MRRTHSCFTIATYLVALVGLTDQFTKWWVVEKIMQPPHVVFLGDYLNLVLVWNRGVTFGILSGVDRRYIEYGLIAVALLIIGFLGRWLWRTSSNLVAIGLGLIMGGAIGNIIDRIRYGGVADFLDFHYQTYHWYAFNIADAAIVTGVGLLLLDSLVRGR